MADLNEMLVAWTGEIDSFMYTYILVILLVFVGIYYTIRTKAVDTMRAWKDEMDFSPWTCFFSVS